MLKLNIKLISSVNINEVLCIYTLEKQYHSMYVMINYVVKCIK